MIYELTRQLIDIPSISGDEAAVGHFLAAHLTKLGYRVETQNVGAENEGRINVLATPSAQGVPRVIFSTHIDTVPPFIPSSEDDEYIYGRGACDAKGIVAAQIAAAEQLRKSGQADFGMLFVVDEEMGSTGARAANAHPMSQLCGYIINGEPTENKLAIGSKGSLRVRLVAHGRAAHSAYPEQGESAIEKLLDALAAVRSVAWPHDEFFGATTCNIGTITGGAAPNVIPAAANAIIQIRLVTPSDVVVKILEAALANCDVSIEYLSAAEPVRMHAVAGFEQSVVRFTTDIPHLTKWGAPLLIGPGSILNAHTSHERVGKKELHEAVALYVSLAESLLAQEPLKTPVKEMRR